MFLFRKVLHRIKNMNIKNEIAVESESVNENTNDACAIELIERIKIPTIIAKNNK